MKLKFVGKLLFSLGCSVLAVSAHASLLLGTPFVLTLPSTILGVSANAPNMTMSGRSQSIVNNTISITYQVGTVTSSAGIDSAFAFSTNPYAPVFTNTLNLTTGAWTFTSNTAGTLASGTLTTPQLASAVTAFNGPQTALRDFADYFVLTFVPAIPCTQPTLWGSGDL
jgi:hypothetical protein